MNKMRVAKFIVSAVVSAGVSKVVGDVIKNNTNVTRFNETVLVFVGSVVIKGVISECVNKYTETKVDELVVWWNENVKDKLNQ